jgi:tRNA modification GTPase
MALHTHDTIVALATPHGPGARAIVRLSGPAVATVLAAVFESEQPLQPLRRALVEGQVRLPDVHASLPADLYIWPAPHSYTGQHVAEIHVLSSPPLVELLIARLLEAGARAAQPGEFTLRAFLAGKLDLTRAEAVLGVIEAGNRDELQEALSQLAGGVARPLQELRDDLLNLLADLEAGLDFADEDIQFVGQEDVLKRLAKGMALVTNLRRQLAGRALSDQPFRAVLAGRPNAGKSSLFNALTESAAALVSPEPGTTRDYLVRCLDLNGIAVELVDTAGLRSAHDAIESQAQELGREQTGRADLLLLCVEAGQTPTDEERQFLQRREPPAVGIATKCDRGTPARDFLATSAVDGTGLSALRELLREKANRRARPALASSLSRCRHHVEACLQCLQRAHQMVLFGEPTELAALDLRSAVDQLGEMVGAVYTDDLLDRIFSRFCIGK